MCFSTDSLVPSDCADSSSFEVPNCLFYAVLPPLGVSLEPPTKSPPDSGLVQRNVGVLERGVYGFRFAGPREVDLFDVAVFVFLPCPAPPS